ncbi:SIMPL domain-containing protein [Pontixanthobacter aestiaquae]|uniref:SIMPL domain-containing protein n=1 Tax=Pontixanthobacter aestiaquae TaxID=1509367 RepID=UPI0025B3B60C|nr:SIMPL domain-containing protein [Pontixanthobacter aestiaquae]MDN3644615.1 SIMPL domain-containing protein [Pontixanthobacter aestiaquae]
MNKQILIPLCVLSLTACGDPPYDPRGVDSDETLLSVSATGEAETRPDEARFQAGVESFARDAKAATGANAEAVQKLVTALKSAGVPEKDIQTRAVGIRRIDWGPKKGQYQANNIVTVVVRDIDRAGDAVTAASEAGANIMSGPDLRMSNPEAAANTAYGNAFKAARARAEAYAAAANMEISRVLTIRDGGGSQGGRYLPGAPRPVSRAVYADAVMHEAAEESGTIMPGQTTSSVSVQVDFALVPK